MWANLTTELILPREENGIRGPIRVYLGRAVVREEKERKGSGNGGLAVRRCPGSGNYY